MATVLSWCLKGFSNSKRLEMLGVQTVTQIAIIQSECVTCCFFNPMSSAATPTKVVNKAHVKVPYTLLSIFSSFLYFTPSWWTLHDRGDSYSSIRQEEIHVIHLFRPASVAFIESFSQLKRDVTMANICNMRNTLGFAFY